MAFIPPGYIAHIVFTKFDNQIRNKKTTIGLLINLRRSLPELSTFSEKITCSSSLYTGSHLCCVPSASVGNHLWCTSSLHQHSNLSVVIGATGRDEVTYFYFDSIWPCIMQPNWVQIQYEPPISAINRGVDCEGTGYSNLFIPVTLIPEHQHTDTVALLTEKRLAVVLFTIFQQNDYR